MSDTDTDELCVINRYRCYSCGHEWEDEWTSQVDDDCPSCGARHCSPYQSEDA